MILLMFALIAGPVGDYLGYDRGFFLASEGYDSLITIVSEDGDTMVVDTVATVDTFTYNGNPAYVNYHRRISTLNAINDTVLYWEIGDTLFGFMMIEGDTLIAKNYVTPFYVGLSWDLQVAGETLIVDIDGDGIDDTLVVRNGEGEVFDSLVLTVGLGTFDVFTVVHSIYIEGWQSLINDQCRIWIWDNQWLCPNVGVVRDSVVIIDSIFMYTWLEGARGCMYSEAVDTGYLAIADFASGKPDAKSLTPLMNGILLNGNGAYDIDIYDISGRMTMQYNILVHDKHLLKPDLPCGVYFARVQGNDHRGATKFVILR